MGYYQLLEIGRVQSDSSKTAVENAATKKDIAIFKPIRKSVELMGNKLQ
jgi:hypothetical protein